MSFDLNLSGLLGTGLGVAGAIESPWQAEQLCYGLCSNFDGIDLHQTSPAQKEIIFGIFRLIMFNNRYVDPLIPRMQHGPRSHQFAEEYYGVPEMMETLLHKQEQENPLLVEPLRRSLETWFRLNRVINFAMQDATDNVIEQDEDPMTMKVRDSAFPETQSEGDSKFSAIFLRCLSSFGFIHPILVASCQGNVAPQVWENQGRMVMIAQLLDDAGSVVKDVELGLNATIASVVQGEHPERPLRLRDDEAIAAVRLAHDVLGGCIDGLHVTSSEIGLLIKYGLMLLASINTPKNMRKYGGTRYPLLTTFRAIFDDVRAPDRHSRRNRMTTKKAMADSFQVAQELFQSVGE